MLYKLEHLIIFHKDTEQLQYGLREHELVKAHQALFLFSKIKSIFGKII